MKRLLKWVSPALPALALLIGVSAGTASAPSGHATPVRPRTVVSVKAPIRAFAQDQETIAWVGSRYWVNVRSLRVRASAAVGYVGPARNGARWSPALTLAGSRALWNTFPSGGNSLESQLETAAPWDPHATAIDLFIDSQTPNGGSFLGGLAGDGPTLVYGRTVERCDDPGGNNCQRLDAVGGVVLVTGQNQTATVPGIPPPVLVAFSAHDPQSSVQISQGLVAVAPAETPVTTDLGSAPRVRQNGPVEVLQLLGGVAHLETRVAPVGTVRAIALDFHQLAVLVERADGTKAIERYEPRRGTLIGTTTVPRTTASELSISTAAIVYRVGYKIYLVSAGKGTPKLVWKASGTPIGLSIEGKRIAWAENVNGRGRIVAMTAPTSARVAASANRAASPKRTGDILFVSGRLNNVYAMHLDGTHRRRIGTARYVWSPAWSPGGRWIAYGATRAAGGLCPQLYLMRADGTHTRRLTHDRNCYLNPTWAPGGTRVAFEVWGGPRTAGIWTMNVNGSGLHLLTTKGNTPAWSPDGRPIAFRSKLPEAIWLMNSDGSNLRQLTLPPRPTVSDMQPDWSPNNKWIAFSRQGGAGTDLYLIGSDGTGLRQLVAYAAARTRCRPGHRTAHGSPS